MSKMADLEIDRRLAKELGYRYVDTKDGELRVRKDKSNIVPRYFRPHWYMNDACEVVEKLGADKLVVQFDSWKRKATIYWGNDHHVSGEKETVPLAICLAALKAIERRKNNGQND